MNSGPLVPQLDQHDLNASQLIAFPLISARPETCSITLDRNASQTSRAHGSAPVAIGETLRVRLCSLRRRLGVQIERYTDRAVPELGGDVLRVGAVRN